MKSIHPKNGIIRIIFSNCPVHPFAHAGGILTEENAAAQRKDDEVI